MTSRMRGIFTRSTPTPQTLTRSPGGGPRHGPPRPPALGAPRETRGAPRFPACSLAQLRADGRGELVGHRAGTRLGGALGHHAGPRLRARGAEQDAGGAEPLALGSGP